MKEEPSLSNMDRGSWFPYNADVEKFLDQYRYLGDATDTTFLRHLIQNSVDSLMRAQSEYGVLSIWVSHFCVSLQTNECI